MMYLFYGSIILFLLSMWFFLQFRRRHKAASNILFAKYSWLRLDKKVQLEVHQKAIELALRQGKGTQGFANEVEQFGWYALAMSAKGLPSAVPENPSWYSIANPYRAIKSDDPLITTISGALKSQFNANVSVNPHERFKVE
ncbi:MAG: hypothetical protein OEX07_06840 [Gammaproteobacteria bacterium]|nr:hypothetical protein [Gammaproteobacteria bacterium]